MPTIVPISALPNGVIATNTLLSATSVATVTENAVVTTLGGTNVGDGNGGIYFFQAGSSRPIDNVLCLGTPTTGRWICANTASLFSGVGPITASQTGYSETFALISGLATAITYTLPPSVNVIGELVTVKTLTTGTVTIRAGNSTDLIYNSDKNTPAVVPVASLTSTLTGGYAWNFRATSGAYYRVDTPYGLI